MFLTFSSRKCQLCIKERCYILTSSIARVGVLVFPSASPLFLIHPSEKGQLQSVSQIQDLCVMSVKLLAEFSLHPDFYQPRPGLWSCYFVRFQFDVLFGKYVVLFL